MRQRKLMRAVGLFVAAGVLAAACGGSDDETADTDPPADDTTADTSGDDTAATTTPDTSGDDTTATTAGDDTTATTAATGGQSDVEPVAGGTVIFGTEAETTGMSSFNDSCANACALSRFAIYDPLFAIDENGEAKGVAAEGYEVNDELTEWTVTLRDGINFTDGTPLNAEAVKRMYDEFLFGSRSGGGPISSLTLESVDVVDDMTVLFTLAEGNAGFLDAMSNLQLGHMFSPTAAAAAGESWGLNPVGSGPFMLESWDVDNEMVLVRNPDYWRTDENGVQLPYLDKVIIRPIPDETSRLNALAAGDIDLMHTLRQSTARDLLELDGAEIVQRIGSVSGSNVYNVTMPPVDDVRVRQGLAHHIDQEILIDILGAVGLIEPSTQWFSPDNPWYSEAAAEAYPTYDPETGNALLQEYVDDPARSDGKSPGDKITIEYGCPPDPSLIQLASAYKELWESSGLVEVNLSQYEQAALVQNAVGSPPDYVGTHMVYCWRSGSDDDPGLALNSQFAPVEAAASNITNYYDEELWALLNEAKRTVDVDARRDLYEQVSLHLAENVPVTYSGPNIEMVAHKPSIENVGKVPLPDGSLSEGMVGGVVSFTYMFRTD